MKTVKTILLLAGAGLSGLGSSLANAQDEAQMESDRLSLRLGALYMGDNETEISARSRRTPLAATINFESDLDLDEAVTAPHLAGYYRFSPHHRVDFEWYRLEREGSRRIGREISLRDRVFNLGTDIESSIDTSVSKLAYTWSFHHTDDVELGVSIGAYALRYDVKLENRAAPLIADESVTAPLPVLGFMMDYRINPGWHVLFDYETFYIELDNDTRGSLDDIQLSLEYRPADNMFFGLGTNRLTLDLDLDDDGTRWDVSELYRGLQLYIGFRF